MLVHILLVAAIILFLVCAGLAIALETVSNRLAGVQADLESRQRVLAVHDQELDRLKTLHAKELRDLRAQLDAARSNPPPPVHINWKLPLDVVPRAEHDMQIAALNADHANETAALKKRYEKQIEDLRTIQSIRVDAIVKQRESEYRSKLNDEREKEKRLGLVIRELIEEAYGCEFPFETPDGSTDAVPCVYIDKSKVWHIKKHGNPVNVRPIPLHDALLKGYAACNVCMDKLPPFFRF